MQQGLFLYRAPEFLSRRLNWVPPPLPVCLCRPRTQVGGDTLAWGGGGGWGNPIQTAGQKLWYSIWYNPIYGQVFYLFN